MNVTAVPLTPVLLPYQVRVINERKELAARLEALLNFIQDPAFEARVPHVEDRVLLETQAEIMQVYLNLLNRRTALWGV